MKSSIIRLATAKRLCYVYNADPTTLTLQEVIEWFEKMHNIAIICSLDRLQDCRKKEWQCYVIDRNNAVGGIPPALQPERMPHFPYRSTKYNLRNDRLEDGINAAITLIDNTLFDTIYD